MDIGKAFTFVFDDERWVTKVLLGGLITAVPILNFATFGYVLKTARNVAYGNPQPLPEWNEDFGDTFMRGLYAFVIYIVYLIPYLIMSFVFGCISGVLTESGSGGETIGVLLSCIILPLAFIVALGSFLLLGAGFARYVVTDSLSEALKIGEVISTVRSNPKPWIMLLLIAFLASLVSMLGLIACFIGVIFTVFYAYCVMGHLLGQTIAQQGTTSAYVPDMPGYDPQ